VATYKINFAKATLASLPLPKAGERNTYHDTKVNGLQLRVTSNGVRTFSVFRWVKSDAKPERITLGRHSGGRDPGMTVDQARTAAITINGQIAEGKNPNDARRESRAEMTLEQLYEEYMARCAAHNRRPDKPKKHYRLYLSHWGKRKLSSIRAHDVQALHSHIGEKNGKVTANIALKLLHVMFNKAINEWRIWKGDNPAHGLKKFPEPSRDRFLQSDELPRFFKAVSKEKNSMMRDFVLLSLMTGARRSNVQEMAWDDVNFERAEWRVQQTKNGTPQTIPLTQDAIRILEARKPPKPIGFVFPGTGKTGHLVEPKGAWKRILKNAEIEDLKIHDLRRTLGSWQAATGANLSVIGKTLHHKSVSTTAIYARLSLDPVRSAMETAGAAMLAAGRLKSVRAKAQRRSIK
jgi:integrase